MLSLPGTHGEPTTDPQRLQGFRGQSGRRYLSVDRLYYSTLHRNVLYIILSKGNKTQIDFGVAGCGLTPPVNARLQTSAVYIHRPIYLSSSDLLSDIHIYHPMVLYPGSFFFLPARTVPAHDICRSNLRKKKIYYMYLILYY